MRILVVHPGSEFSVADVFDGLVASLARFGHQVASYNLNDRLVFFGSCRFNGEPLTSEMVIQHAGLGLHGKLWEWWPDLVVVISGFYVHPWTWDILRHRPHATAIVFTESPYEDDRQCNLVEKAEPDYVFVNDPTNIERFRAVHPRVEYLPHAYDPERHHPPSPITTARPMDFSFVGTGYPSRIRFFEAVDWDGIDVKLGGHWADLSDTKIAAFQAHPPGDCMSNNQTAEWYRQTKVSANLYRGNDSYEANAPELAHGWAMGPREVELAACHTFFLREPRAEGDELFPMLPTFTEPGEFSELLRWWLLHEDARNTAARDACNAIADRTFDANARRILQLVDT